MHTFSLLLSRGAVEPLCPSPPSPNKKKLTCVNRQEFEADAFRSQVWPWPQALQGLGFRVSGVPPIIIQSVLSAHIKAPEEAALRVVGIFVFFLRSAGGSRFFRPPAPIEWLFQDTIQTNCAKTQVGAKGSRRQRYNQVLSHNYAKLMSHDAPTNPLRMLMMLICTG